MLKLRGNCAALLLYISLVTDVVWCTQHATLEPELLGRENLRHRTLENMKITGHVSC